MWMLQLPFFFVEALRQPEVSRKLPFYLSLSPNSQHGGTGVENLQETEAGNGQDALLDHRTPINHRMLSTPLD
jgi:hypothetical protein